MLLATACVLQSVACGLGPFCAAARSSWFVQPLRGSRCVFFLFHPWRSVPLPPARFSAAIIDDVFPELGNSVRVCVCMCVCIFVGNYHLF